jgi:hypothetical protein
MLRWRRLEIAETGGIDISQMRHKACFATMIPAALESARRTSVSGKALAWESVPSGGRYAPERTVMVDI